MRILIGAAAAALLVAGAAMAQTTTSAPATAATTTAQSGPHTIPVSHCPALQPEPSLPDGAHASAQQMQVGETSYHTWAVAYQASLQCRRAEAEELRAQADYLANQYNNSAHHLNDVSAQWVASGQAFQSAHGRNSQPHDRRSVHNAGSGN